MGRATIPYDKLQDAVRKRYPGPVFLFPKIRTDNFNTPTRVYDRRTGNYAPIGWRITVDYTQFFGFNDATIEPIYVNKSESIIIQM